MRVLALLALVLLLVACLTRVESVDEGSARGLSVYLDADWANHPLVAQVRYVIVMIAPLLYSSMLFCCHAVFQCSCNPVLTACPLLCLSTHAPPLTANSLANNPTKSTGHSWTQW